MYGAMALNVLINLILLSKSCNNKLLYFQSLTVIVSVSTIKIKKTLLPGNVFIPHPCYLAKNVITIDPH